MRIALVSDIHGNGEALRAVARDMEAFAPDEIWNLGDTVGYGPEPEFCLEWTRTHCRWVLLGNHDAAVCGKMDPWRWFHGDAAQIVEWTRTRLQETEWMEYLRNLPTQVAIQRWQAFLVHGAPTSNPYLDYILLDVPPETAFLRRRERFILVGHSHLPFLITFDGYQSEMVYPPEERRPMEVPYEKRRRYLVNPGSVGQPRNGDPRASWVLWDVDKEIMHFRKVEYDVEKTIAKMAAENLPEAMRERLRYGR